MSQGQIKKVIRKSPTERALSKYLPEIVNSIYLFGKVGKGKTTTMISLCQGYHDLKGYKWFYLWGGERNEHLYISFPTRELKYWGKIKKKFSLSGDAPKQNQVHLLYPYFESTMPPKLPSDPPNIRSSVFTIPYHTVNLQNIMHVIGNPSEATTFIWRNCLEVLGDDTPPNEFVEYAKKIGKKDQVALRNFIEPLFKNRILQRKSCPYNLNLLEELKDRKTVTILCFEFIPEEFRIFILEWFLSQMAQILDKNRGLTRNVLTINEASEFFRATDDSIMPDRYKVFRRSLSQYLRMGRRGMKFVLNCQSPSETKGIVSGQDDYTILCNMTSPFDIDIATEHLRKAKLIRPDQIDELYRFKPGQFLFCESGKPARKQYYFKPRTLYWKPGMGDFYKHTYKELSNNWKSTEGILTEMSESIDVSLHETVKKAIKKREMDSLKRELKLETDKPISETEIPISLVTKKDDGFKKELDKVTIDDKEEIKPKKTKRVKKPRRKTKEQIMEEIEQDKIIKSIPSQMDGVDDYLKKLMAENEEKGGTDDNGPEPGNDNGRSETDTGRLSGLDKPSDEGSGSSDDSTAGEDTGEEISTSPRISVGDRFDPGLAPRLEEG